MNTAMSDLTHLNMETVDRYINHLCAEINTDYPSMQRIASISRSIAVLAEEVMKDQSLNPGD